METVRCAAVCGGTAANDPREVISPRGVNHPERPKDARSCEFWQRHPADAFHNNRGKVVARVAVGPLRTWREVEGALARCDVERVGVRVNLRASRMGQRGDVAPIAHSARMIQQVSNSDGTLEGADFRQILFDRIVKPQLTITRKKQDRRRRELLRN